MRLAEALDLIRPAVDKGSGLWADFGAGEGLFSRALAQVLDRQGRVMAVDRNARVLRALERRARGEGAAIETAVGDFRELGGIDALSGARLSGALFANSLHFVAEPSSVLGALASFLLPSAPVVVVEYDRDKANPWVPHPLPPTRLGAVAAQAGYAEPRVVARRPSVYHREMYCAVFARAPVEGRR